VEYTNSVELFDFMDFNKPLGESEQLEPDVTVEDEPHVQEGSVGPAEV